MYLCRVGYIGWYFHGTNVQPGLRTVEGEAEKILGGKVRFLSRTDRGVSAMNNYALCNANKNPFSVNEHPYIWLTGYTPIKRRPKVFWRWYRYYLPFEVDLTPEDVEPFLGKKDFRYLSAEDKNTVREVLSIEVMRRNGFTVVDIKGVSFLRQMVRRLVNAILMVHKGVSPDDIFRGRVRVDPLPPEGLVLMDMKLDTPVNSDVEYVKRAKEKIRRLYTDLKLKSLILSNEWII